MTTTIISLVSIFIGIIAANVFASVYPKHSFGIIGNTIAGVFGSIFLIKSFGRLGFSPFFIVHNGYFNIYLFLINCLVSLLGGVIALILIKRLKNSTTI